MPSKTPDKTESFDISLSLDRVIRDLSQFVSDQKDLDNIGLKISDSSKQILESWVHPETMPGPPGRDFLSQGPENSKIWFVDTQPSFFKGEPGALLKKIIRAMNLDPAKVFICTCTRPETLENRLKISCPDFLILLGEKTVRCFTGSRESMEKIQGRFLTCCGIPAMPTYHPNDLLAEPDLKRPVWNALQQVMTKAGLKK
ncbi:uracil-DNA glycosylase family protein [Desulfospira joergensenii]|uniref:uracil-DNA glycosylase family protein n=1 Tax=Desulfospira joergensenii TaxID=53329 RepID=UPI0003B3C99E|nr:uracil-DNA glycosylase family protein [Desulfospira joergensenii]